MLAPKLQMLKSTRTVTDWNFSLAVPMQRSKWEPARQREEQLGFAAQLISGLWEHVSCRAHRQIFLTARINSIADPSHTTCKLFPLKSYHAWNYLLLHGSVVMK